MSVSQNVTRIRECIASAAHRSGRNPDEITLMAVSKTHPPESIREAYDAGLRVFGENRVQGFSGKAAALADLTDVQWHLIGHLQSNKAAKAAELFDAIDSVDSVKLAEKLNSTARGLGKKLKVLIEVNIGREAAKSGLISESSELENLLQATADFKSLEFRGLMTIPPFTENPENARPYFRQLRELQDSVASRKLPSISMDVLSMGMSHDFEVAIEEGSTCVRVGTAIFGERGKK